MTERPAQRPEGRLIATAQAQRRPKLSNREAASRVPMSEGHWRAVVSGSRSVGKGIWVPVRAPAETLARMAQVVGVTAEQLVEAGRDDAAAELLELPPLGSEREPTVQELTVQLRELREWFESDRERNRQVVERLQREIDRLRHGDAG